MTTDKKKFWVVRAYVAGAPHHLEDTLNQIDNEGYTIFEINTDKQQIIAYLRDDGGDNFLTKLFRPPMATEGEQIPDTERAQDPLKSYEMRGRCSNMIFSTLTRLMESQAAGDIHTENRVQSLVATATKRSTNDEIRLALEDTNKVYELHVNHVRTISTDGQPCNETCPVNVVLKLAAKYLEMHLAAHPVS